MAIVRSNDLTKGLGGLFGNIVFRQLRGKTYVSPKPAPPAKQCEAQRSNCSKFKDASVYAKACILIPEKKAYYVHKAKKLMLPNAYTAAITDYMRKGTIWGNRKCLRPTGKRREAEFVFSPVKRISKCPQVHVSIADEKEIVLYTGPATKVARDIFDFRRPDNLNPVPGIIVTIHASGVGGHVISLTTVFG